jgi:DNA mismatch repair protein MutS2
MLDAAPSGPRERDHVRFVRADEGSDTAASGFEGGGSTRCDLRGRRVDEALDALGAALDEATAEGREELVIIHGLGTGALRSAVREHLAGSPYVLDLKAGDPRAGGDGVTVASLGRPGT